MRELLKVWGSRLKLQIPQRRTWACEPSAPSQPLFGVFIFPPSLCLCMCLSVRPSWQAKLAAQGQCLCRAWDWPLWHAHTQTNMHTLFPKNRGLLWTHGPLGSTLHSHTLYHNFGHLFLFFLLFLALLCGGRYFIPFICPPNILDKRLSVLLSHLPVPCFHLPPWRRCENPESWSRGEIHVDAACCSSVSPHWYLWSESWSMEHHACRLDFFKNYI